MAPLDFGRDFPSSGNEAMLRGADINQNHISVYMLIGLLGTAATAACAQDSQSPAADDTTTQVIVKGEKRKATDRDVYEVDKDVQTADGTVADALNKVPGVAVDPAGYVTLRGRQVEIYVNGHPSLILAGDNRGAALRSMPSRYISSIEVISTPGAQFGSQGAGGIINLVTSHGLPEGRFGTISAAAQSTGGYTANAFLNWHIGKLTASGFLFYNRNISDTRSSQDLTPFDTAGRPLQTTQSQGISHSTMGSPNATANLEYELGPNDLLRGQAAFMQMDGRTVGVTRYAIHNGNGLPQSQYVNDNSGQSAMNTGTIGLGWTHYGKRPDETLKLDGTVSRRQSDFSFQDRYSDGQQGLNSTQNRSRTDTADITLDYNTTVGNDQVSTGLQWTEERETARNSGTITAFDSAFDYKQRLAAAYIAYQREFGDKWTVLAGLRSETLDLDTRLISANSNGHVAYTRLNPSFFATYVISSKARWRFSYAHRLQRPMPRDLNPYVIYIDATHVGAGNPRLRPQETGIFEAVYEHTDQANSYTVRGFYNRDDHLITAASIAEPDSAGNTVIRTTPVNAGTATSGGIAVNTNHRFTPKLYLNADATLQTMQVPASNRVGAQSLTALSGSLSLGYTLSGKDSLNFNINLIGKRLTGQGYMSSFAMDNLFWSHSLTPKVQLNVTLSNMLRMAKMSFVTDSNVLRSVSTTSPESPTLTITLSRSFSRFPKP